jgi:hypothetical protein
MVLLPPRSVPPPFFWFFSSGGGGPRPIPSVLRISPLLHWPAPAHFFLGPLPSRPALPSALFGHPASLLPYRVVLPPPHQHKPATLRLPVPYRTSPPSLTHSPPTLSNPHLLPVFLVPSAQLVAVFSLTLRLWFLERSPRAESRIALPYGWRGSKSLKGSLRFNTSFLFLLPSPASLKAHGFQEHTTIC